jgi:hypothetical protein
MPHLEYRDLTEDDPNFTKEYRILIEESQAEIVKKLTELKELIEKGDLKPWEFAGLKTIWFGQHLYQRLLYLDQNVVEICPVPLNKGERLFVEDLKEFHDNNGGFFVNKQLYLLRNMSKGRGVGFFEAGNFHPDFILWLLVAGRQHVVFVDPKGDPKSSPNGPKDPILPRHQRKQRLGDPKVLLHSFIISNTPSHTMKMLWRMDKAAMQEHHILFQVFPVSTSWTDWSD